MEKMQDESTLPVERLRKTASEQAILRNIEALEAERLEASEEERKRELDEQISLLRESLASIQGPAYSELEKENKALKEKLKNLEAECSALGRQCKELSGRIAVPASLGENIETQLRLRLYRLLLKKYSGLINESEKKTVGELKSLIDDEDLTVNSIIQSYKPENYKFEKHYLTVAKKLFEFITKEIDYVKAETDINFWLSPKEIIAEKVGDDEDLAVFLCSILYVLGDEKAEVVIAELDNLTTHAFVITEYKEKFILLDPSQKKPFNEFSGDRKEILKKYSFEGARIKRFLYKFNRNNYEQFV